MSEYPSIYFIEINDRRKMRRAKAARFEVFYSDGESELLWMDKKDIKKNIDAFPHCAKELSRGLFRYGN